MSTATTATRTHEPKRCHVNLDVIDSPACAMPQYATYRRHYYLVSGSCLLTGAETLDDIVDKGRAWADERSRIVRIPAIPYYDERRKPDGVRENVRPVGRASWAGGTWGGNCGSAIWVTDPTHTYRNTFAALHALNPDGNRYMQDGPLANADTGMLQAWWTNGVADRHDTLDGFWVECQQPRRTHLGLCTGLDLTWNWRDYAPWTDQGHNTQLALGLGF